MAPGGRYHPYNIIADFLINGDLPDGFSHLDYHIGVGYLFKVIAIDNDGNESNPVAATGVTLLPNPAALVADPQSGYVDLTWAGAAPLPYVKHYTVYKSESDFSTVEGLSPLLTTTNTTAKVAGLTNGDFSAEVDGTAAAVVGGGFIQENYWLLIRAPTGLANGTYDLEVFMEEPGGGAVIASATEASSVEYTSDLLDHVLVIDRSGSISTGPSAEKSGNGSSSRKGIVAAA